MPSPSQIKKRLTQTTWHHSIPTAARERIKGSADRIKGSADYSALIQKAWWLETRTQHLILKYLRERRNNYYYYYNVCILTLFDHDFYISL